MATTNYSTKLSGFGAFSTILPGNLPVGPIHIPHNAIFQLCLFTFCMMQFTLQAQLGEGFSSALEARSATAVGHVLNAYAAIGDSAGAEEVLRRDVVKPLLAEALRSSKGSGPRIGSNALAQVPFHLISPALTLSLCHVSRQYDTFAVSNNDSDVACPKVGLRLTVPFGAQYISPLTAGRNCMTVMCHADVMFEHAECFEVLCAAWGTFEQRLPRRLSAPFPPTGMSSPDAVLTCSEK